ncbi:MAG: AI-2E family transporter [Spirochaetota bacterium]
MTPVEKALRTVIYIVAVILVGVVLKYAASVTLPLTISVFCFFILSPFVNKMEKAGFPRGLAIMLAMAVLVCVFVIAILFVTFAVDSLVRDLPVYSVRISMLINTLDQGISSLMNMESGVSFLDSLSFNWQSVVFSMISNISGSAVTIFSYAFLVFIFVLFLLLERQSLIPKMRISMPNHGWIRWAVVFERINRQISKYLTVKTLISISTGVLFYLAALATRLDFAFIIGVLAFVLNFIPTIGSIIITITSILLAVVQYYPDYANILYVAVLMASIQMVLGNILDPRVQGNRLNLSPFVILVSLALWGYIWGVIGMFLAVPITAAIQILCDNVPSLKPAAVLLGSGRQYRKQIEREERLRKERYAKERRKRRNHRYENAHDVYEKKTSKGNNQSSAQDPSQNVKG